jgi:hypothetical protein
MNINTLKTLILLRDAITDAEKTKLGKKDKGKSKA